MKNKEYILLEHFCKHTSIHNSFIQSLIYLDVITYMQNGNRLYILEEEINQIESMFRLHNDLGVNVEGLGVINEMLNRIRQLEKEVTYLKNKLNLYE